MVSLAFVLAFVASAVALLIGIIIFSQVQDDMIQTFGDPLLISNGTGFTSTTPIAHSYTEQILEQTHTGDTNYTTILSLSSGEFTAGNKYLIMFRAEVGGSDANFNYAIKSLHGSTDFEGSEKIYKPDATSTDRQYNWFTVWTAVGGESLTMQFRNVDSSTKIVRADQITIVAIELEDFIENEDYFFDVRTTDDVLQCVVFNAGVVGCNPVGLWTQTNPSVTFTANGSDDWLVMATSLMNPESVWIDPVQSRINLDDTILTPLMRVSDENQGGTNPNSSITRQDHFLARVYTPSASSHTFENEASFIKINSALGHPVREHSQIFAINLDKFEYHTDNNNPTPFASENNIYTVLANGNPFFTPVIGFGNGAFESNTMTVDSPNTEDTFILSFNTMQYLNNGGGQFRQRMQVDDGSGTDFILDHEQKESYKDQPLTQTDHTQGCSPSDPLPCNTTIFYNDYQQGVLGDFTRWSVFTMLDLTTLYPLNDGVVNVDVDSVWNTASSASKIHDGQLVAISMSAKTFEFTSQVPPEFITASNIAFTVIGIIPIVLFFFLFAIFGGRFGE